MHIIVDSWNWHQHMILTDESQVSLKARAADACPIARVRGSSPGPSYAACLTYLRSRIKKLTSQRSSGIRMSLGVPRLLTKDEKRG